MANPIKGEVTATIAGTPFTLAFDFNALCTLEDDLGVGVDELDGNQSNTLFGHLPEDLDTYGGGLIWSAPFLTNDFGSGFHGNTPGAPRAAQIMQRLAEYKNLVNQAGGKFAFGFGPPLRYDNAASAPDAEWTMTRNAFIANFRDPAVWSTVCDYYVPVGEQPDFNAADNSAVIGTDLVHPTEFGQTKLLSVNLPTLKTLLDPARVNATTMHGSAWPSGAANLSVGGKSIHSFVVSGLAHKGIAIGGQSPYQLSAGPDSRVRLNNGAFGSSVTGWLYNGDTVFQEVTHSASPNTDFTRSLTVGSETRQIPFKTASGGQVAYSHGGIAGVMPDAVVAQAVHNFPARTFTASGTAAIVVEARGTPSSVRFGNAQATSRGSISGMYGDIILTAWTVPVDISGGADKDIVVTYPAGVFKTTLAWGTVTGANPVPSSIVTDATNGGDPHGPGPLDLAAGGLALGYFGETGGDTTSPAVVQAGTPVAQGWGPSRQEERQGINLAKRTDDGPIGWNFGYAPYPSIALLFDPA